MGHTDSTMIGFLFLLFPVLLMLFMLGMERLEEPLTRVAVERDVEHFLDQADACELDTLVREGADTAVWRFRGRLRRQRVHLPRLRLGAVEPGGIRTTAVPDTADGTAVAATADSTAVPDDKAPTRPNTDQLPSHP